MPAARLLGGWVGERHYFGAYTGTPFTVTAPGSSLNAPNNTQTADQIGPIDSSLARSVPATHCYNATSSFASITGFRFGFDGPQYPAESGRLPTRIFDMTREFPIRDRLKLQFRGEVFNISNTAHFGGSSSSSVTSGSFMQITSASGQ